MLEIYFIGFLAMLFFHCANSGYTKKICAAVEDDLGEPVALSTIVIVCALWPIAALFMITDFYKGAKNDSSI